jgi:RNA polymerase sigma factor (sigma-70 family)
MAKQNRKEGKSVYNDEACIGKRRLIKNFLNEDKQNKVLYHEWKNCGNEKALEELTEKFKYFLFRIHLYSYISKSLTLKAKEIRIKHIKLKSIEELSLNSLNPETGEEMINMLISDTVDFENEILQDNSDLDYTEIVTDRKLLNAINSLSETQRLILYRCIVENLKESEIAKELKISVQAVNKNKSRAIKKIRSAIGVD